MAAAVLDERDTIRATTTAFRSLSPALADGCSGQLLEQALKQASSDHTLFEGSLICRIDTADDRRWYRDRRMIVSDSKVAVLLDVSAEWRLLSRHATASHAQAEELRREASDNARRLSM